MPSERKHSIGHSNFPRQDIESVDSITGHRLIRQKQENIEI
jgi:hypothetical protein